MITQKKTRLLLIISLIGIILIFFFERLPQDPAYHKFADSNTLFSIPNFWNVFSNLPLVIAGIAGLLFLLKMDVTQSSTLYVKAYRFFFLGVALSGMGSAYYHLAPANDSLVWDRLPMTIAFMAFFTIILSEFVSFYIGQILFYPLLVIGIVSVVYWQITESMMIGDLRFYILVQFLPLILTVVILILFRSNSSLSPYIWFILLAYFIAKVFELFDYEIYQMTKFVSGHFLKHIAASIAPIILIFALVKKRYKSHNE